LRSLAICSCESSLVHLPEAVTVASAET
jgi:hypothetical protein